MANIKLIIMKNYLHQRKNSLGYAWAGLVCFFRSETHATLHFFAAVLVLVLAWLFSVSQMEWISLILAIALVILAEMINTVVEKIADFVQPENDPGIRVIKDMAAAAVLWCAIIAVVIGVVVFSPYVIELFMT